MDWRSWWELHRRELRRDVETIPSRRLETQTAIMIRSVEGQWLIQVRGENRASGRTGHVYLAPSIQVRSTNLAQDKFAFSGYLSRVEWLTEEGQMCSDPDRLEGACRMGIISVHASEARVEPVSTHRWFTTAEIDAALQAGVPFSTHLWAIIGIWRSRQTIRGGPNGDSR